MQPIYVKYNCEVCKVNGEYDIVKNKFKQKKKECKWNKDVSFIAMVLFF